MSFTQTRTQTLQVTGIRMALYGSGNEAITHICTGSSVWTKAQAIAAIDANPQAFYTNVGGKAAWVGVVDGPNGRYLQTHADGYWNNNLLALPRC